MKRPRSAPVLITLLALPLAACGSSQPSTSLDGPIQDYDEGRYAAAHDEATDVMRQSEGQAHHDAAYLSGLSAYRLGELGASERLLLTAAESEDPTTAANAKATLGLVRLEQNRPAEAAALFREAANGLSGEDQQRAQAYAAAAKTQAGGARASAGQGPLSTAGRNGEPYALQVGAFGSRERAERAAAEARSFTARAGLGPARVEPRTNRGQTLWVVQFGRFPSRGEAASARSRLGRPDYIVVSAAP